MRIQEQVDSFETMVIPRTASDVQSNAMRLSFLSGWWSAFQSMTTYVASLPDDQAEEQMKKYSDECEALLALERAKIVARHHARENSKG